MGSDCNIYEVSMFNFLMGVLEYLKIIVFIFFNGSNFNVMLGNVFEVDDYDLEVILINLIIISRLSIFVVINF